MNPLFKQAHLYYAYILPFFLSLFLSLTVKNHVSQDPTFPNSSVVVFFYNIHPRDFQDLAAQLEYTLAKLVKLRLDTTCSHAKNGISHGFWCGFEIQRARGRII